MAEDQQTTDDQSTDLLDDDTGQDSLDPKDQGADDKKPLDKDSKADLSDDADGDLLSDDEDPDQKDGETSYSFEVPEELKGMPINEEALGAFKDVAKELGLSQEQFQKLAEFDLRNAVAADQQATEAWNERVKDWKQSVLKDKDIGGENLADTKVNAKAAIEKFADPELVALFKSPSEQNPEGLAIGNHPAVMKFLNRIGKALADPEFHGGDEPPQDADTLKRMYPSMYNDKAA